MLGEKHQSVSDISPATALPQSSLDQRKQNRPPMRLKGMQAQRAIVNSQVDRGPLALMKYSPIAKIGRAPGCS
jgi:hypothetical protein